MYHFEYAFFALPPGDTGDGTEIKVGGVLGPSLGKRKESYLGNLLGGGLEHWPHCVSRGKVEEQDCGFPGEMGRRGEERREDLPADLVLISQMAAGPCP